MEIGGWTTAENVALVIALLTLVTLMAISVMKNLPVSALCVVIVFVAISYFIHNIDKSRISKAHLARQINPEVPTHGYKWVGTQTWVLYKDGKLSDIVMYKK